jgi:histidinol-phosphate/aromatic aminotransferase/cobyric acid decarboxylase-like protein
VYRNEVRLDFSVNLDPLPMPESVKDAMLKGIEEIHQYPDPLQQKLREKIGALEGVGPHSIVCGNGASELLMATVHAVKPKRALIAAPCYAGYGVALAAEDTEIKEYFLSEEKDYTVDAGFIDSITDDTDIVFIADPNNPNGRLLDPEIKAAIARKCEECGAVLVIDECFYPLTEAGLAGTVYSDNALHLRAFTKTFAIPGIRIGYMISNNGDLLSLIRKHLPEWNVSRIAERTGEAAAEVLLDTDYLEKSVDFISRERTFLTDKLTGLGIKVYPSDTNYLLLKSYPGLYEQMIKRGILIRRCGNFSGLDDTYFRIAVKEHRENEELVSIIAGLLNERA